MTISEIVMLVVMVITLVSVGWLFRGWYLLSMEFVKSFWNGE